MFLREALIKSVKGIKECSDRKKKKYSLIGAANPCPRDPLLQFTINMNLGKIIKESSNPHDFSYLGVMFELL